MSAPTSETSKINIEGTNSATMKNTEETKEKQNPNQSVETIVAKSNETNNNEDNINKNNVNTELTEEEKIIIKLGREIENLCEPSNILQNPNVQSHVNENGYLHIDFLKSLPNIQAITTNSDVIINAISKNKKLKCKDNIYVKYEPSDDRNVLILRDFPPNVSLEEVKKIFDHPECGVIKEIRPEIENNWFVTCENEDQCIKTVQYLQKHGTFQNKPLHVRVKASSTLYNANKLLYGEPKFTEQLNASFCNVDQMVYDQMYSSSPLDQKYVYPPYVYYPYSPILQPVSIIATKFGKNVQGSPIPHTSPKQPIQLLPQQMIETKIFETTMPINESGVYSPLMLSNIRQKYTSRQWTSDYPNHNFQKYSSQDFLEVFKQLSINNDLSIPNSMKGRDLRVVSEELEPVLQYETVEMSQELRKIHKQESGDDLFHGYQQNRGTVHNQINYSDDNENNKNKNELRSVEQQTTSQNNNSGNQEQISKQSKHFYKRKSKFSSDTITTTKA